MDTLKIYKRIYFCKSEKLKMSDLIWRVSQIFPGPINPTARIEDVKLRFIEVNLQFILSRHISPAAEFRGGDTNFTHLFKYKVSVEQRIKISNMNLTLKFPCNILFLYIEKGEIYRRVCWS